MAEQSDIVERRQRYIERQIQLNSGDVNVRFRGQAPKVRVPAIATACRSLPVGQHEVKNWPVLDLGEQPDIDLGAGSSRSAASSRIRTR